MSWLFILSQLFGIGAIIFLIISFQINDKDKLLKFQIVSSFLNFFQYLLLGGITGSLMNLVAGIRNIVFKKYGDKKIPIYVLVFFIVLITFLSSLSYSSDISLLPMLASLNYTFALWTGDLRLIRILDVFSSLLLCTYDVFVFSIAGFVLHFIELSSALVGIYKFDIKKQVG